MAKKQQAPPVIVQILRDCWEDPPERKAALCLRQAGITAQRFWEFCCRDDGRAKYQLSEVWTNNTWNELQDLEREDKAARKARCMP